MTRWRFSQPQCSLAFPTKLCLFALNLMWPDPMQIVEFLSTKFQKKLPLRWKTLFCSHLSISSCMTTYPYGETMSLQDVAMVQHCNVAWLYEKNAFIAQVLEAPLSWPITWTWCATSPLHKTNLRTAIHTSILWPLSFQGLNYRLLKVRIGTLHTWLCSTCAALWIRSGPLQGVDIHSELDGIRCRLGSQVVETCLEAKLPSVEMHGRKLCSAGIHHVNVPRRKTKIHWHDQLPEITGMLWRLRSSVRISIWVMRCYQDGSVSENLNEFRKVNKNKSQGQHRRYERALNTLRLAKICYSLLRSVKICQDSRTVTDQCKLPGRLPCQAHASAWSPKRSCRDPSNPAANPCVARSHCVQWVSSASRHSKDLEKWDPSGGVDLPGRTHQTKHGERTSSACRAQRILCFQGSGLCSL